MKCDNLKGPPNAVKDIIQYKARKPYLFKMHACPSLSMAQNHQHPFYASKG